MITYLALGDSYTIGEQVPIYESFPYQLVSLARSAGWKMAAPEIVAKTGWTTDELIRGIASTRFLPAYDWVSLLIGVNNQYREGSMEIYAEEFRYLLEKSIELSGGKPDQVVVISIPDWGQTPYAAERNRHQISEEIDRFNSINQVLAAKQRVGYVNITPGSRLAINDPSLLTSDELHPSGKEYGRWAMSIWAYLSQNAGGVMPSALK